MKIFELINIPFLESNLYSVLDMYGIIDYLANHGHEDVDIIAQIIEAVENAYRAKTA